MKTVLSLVLVLAVSGPVAVRADEGKMRAAVVTQTTIASLKLVPGKMQGARPTVEMGKVYEVVSATGAMPGLKIDGDRVAMVNPAVIKTRECTTDEFSSAQQKFNNTTFEAERKTVMATFKTKVESAKKLSCATCPKVRAQGAEREQQAQIARDKALREIERKKEALLKEALAWAAAK